MEHQAKKNRELKKLFPITDFGPLTTPSGKVRIVSIQERLRSPVLFPHRHDFYQFVMIRSGSGKVFVDFKNYEVAAGRIFLTKPGQVISQTLSDNTTGWIVEFDRDFLLLDSSASKMLIRAVDYSEDIIDFTPANSNAKLNPFKIASYAYDEAAGREIGFEVVILSLVKVLVIMLSRLSPARLYIPNEKIPFTEEFHAVIEQHFRKQHSVKFYAKLLGTSPKALTMRLERICGKTVRHYIHQRIILESKRLLAYSEDSIQEIAYELGFEDPNYFSRFFHRQTGSTPAAFRKKSRN